MKTFSMQRRLGNGDVDLHMRLRTSALFGLLQEASIRHTEALGAGRAVTLDRGLLWAVTLQRCEIARMPTYDEKVTVETWPGETMHVLFPRYYVLRDERGEPLLRASALWVLMDQKTRKLVFPERAGVRVEGTVTGEELSLPTPPPALETHPVGRFRVPYSYVDLNGHMNNARYFDLAEDRLPAPAEGRPLREVLSQYAGEARLGEELEVAVGEEKGRYLVTGRGERELFRLSLTYGRG